MCETKTNVYVSLYRQDVSLINVSTMFLFTMCTIPKQLTLRCKTGWTSICLIRETLLSGTLFIGFLPATPHFGNHVHNHVTSDILLTGCFAHVPLKHDSQIKQCFFFCLGVMQMINRECAKPFCFLFGP